MHISDLEEYQGQLFGLIKITNYVDSLLDGNIYMNTLENYITMEKETGIKGVGDKLEASHVFSDLTMHLVHPSTGERILMGTCSELTFKSNGDEKKPVYCMLGLHGGLLKITGEDNNYYHTEIDLTKIDTTKTVKEFGNSMVFINPNGLMQRLIKELDKHNLSFKADLVKYDNYTVNNSNRINTYKNEPYSNFFWKDKFFSNQHEYRIVLTDYETDEPLILNIGDIRDISHVFKVEEFFSTSFELSIKKKGL